MLRDFSLFNRPLSPHLTIYSPQHSSLFSIWHRFSGILLLFLLFIVLVFVNFFSFCSIQNYSYVVELFLNYEVVKVIFSIAFLISIYHFLNGIRHLLWDLGFLLYKAYFMYFTILVVLVFLLFIINI